MHLPPRSGMAVISRHAEQQLANVLELEELWKLAATDPQLEPLFGSADHGARLRARIEKLERR